MSDRTLSSRWRSTISHRVQEREVRRLVWHAHSRLALAGRGPLAGDLAARIPTIWTDFAGMMLGALLAFWLAARLLSWAFGVDPLLVYLPLGLLFSAQSAYYKYRLTVDPNYKIPRCGCAKTPRSVDAEKVLASKEGELLPWIPNALIAVLIYALLLTLAWGGHLPAVGALAAAACLFGAYLAYAMLFRIGSLCSNCINIAALNVLVLARIVL